MSVLVNKNTKVIVQGRHLEITDSIREYAEEKINKAVAHFDQHDVREVDVRCSSRGGADKKTPGGALQKTEVTVYTKNGIIRAEEEADDLYASIDAVSDKLERKLRKVKEKKISKRPKHNKNAPKAQTDAIVAEMAAADEALADESGARAPSSRRRSARATLSSSARIADSMRSGARAPASVATHPL